MNRLGYRNDEWTVEYDCDGKPSFSLTVAPRHHEEHEYHEDPDRVRNATVEEIVAELEHRQRRYGPCYLVNGRRDLELTTKLGLPRAMFVFFGKYRIKRELIVQAQTSPDPSIRECATILATEMLSAVNSKNREQKQRKLGMRERTVEYEKEERRKYIVKIYG
jgi:hypothetical protein